MLGKFDESYVYEKETDILSDSDPTDCEEQTAEGKYALNLQISWKVSEFMKNIIRIIGLCMVLQSTHF